MSLKDTFANTHLPYCLQEQEGGRYIVLNGNMQPVGFTKDRKSGYKDLPISVDLSFMTDKFVQKIFQCTENDPKRIYLCDDPTLLITDKERMSAYWKRVKYLMTATRQVEVQGGIVGFD